MTTYCDDRVYQTYAIEYEIQEISQRFDRLQQLLENKNGQDYLFIRKFYSFFLEEDPCDNEKGSFIL